MPRTLVDRDQALIDSRDQRFTVSTAANIYGNLDIPSNRMDPGEQLEVNLALDVPVGTAPRSMVLRESATSDVVKRLPHCPHSRRRRMASPSSIVRESITLESSSRQNGHFMTWVTPFFH